jgi:16S rRNA (guanine966-N2)-methyltransferase
MANPRPKGHNGLGQLRIIGGEWGSRKLTFPDAPGLRPTPDRVRETLFNWLAMDIAGAKVLDVFTGSGALFFEALSRGASKGLALDNSAAAIASLRQNLSMLNCTTGQVSQTDSLRHLENQPGEPFDVVFLDPPFHQNLLASACALLESHGWLAENAWIYTESETPPSTTGLPGNWRLHREKKAGQVYYALWQRG